MSKDTSRYANILAENNLDINRAKTKDKCTTNKDFDNCDEFSAWCVSWEFYQCPCDLCKHRV